METTDSSFSEDVEARMCVDATGCRGAGDYRPYAREQGFSHLRVVEWTSSAGNWTFLVSRDGRHWYLMYQGNNFPRGSGFTRKIDEDGPVFYGTAEEAMVDACAFINGG